MQYITATNMTAMTTAMIISWDAFPPVMTASLFSIWIPVSALNKDY